MRFSLINSPFCVKLCISGGGQEKYQVIVVPDRLFIAKVRSHDTVQDQLAIYPNFAIFFLLKTVLANLLIP